jgi:RsiW-degrading membrane proteinase PrsW (M82 family)
MELRRGTGARARRPERWRWLVVFGGGLLLWILAVITTAITGNPALVPTVILLGSFLVPVTAVVWNFDHEADSALSGQRVAYAFIAGGVLGTVAASLLESWLVQDGLLTYLGVGFIEEFVKLAALVAFAVGLASYTTRDGLVLGAAVGFGFAALESAGYAFVALFSGQDGASLASLVGTEILRGMLAPIGHGLWTAILGAVLFRAASRSGRLRVTWGLVGAYLLVSLLHALWDSMHGIAILVTVLLTATQQQLSVLAHGVVPTVTTEQVALFILFEFGGMLLVALIGIAVLLGIWRRWVRGTAAGS